MSYSFNDNENEITKLLPAYMYKYEDDSGNGLFTFIKYLTNYIKDTGATVINNICEKLSINSAVKSTLSILADRIGAEIPSFITNENDMRIVVKGSILNRSSNGTGIQLEETIRSLFPALADADIQIIDYGILSGASSTDLMRFALKIYKPISQSDKTIVNDYLIPDFTGVSHEFQLVTGTVFMWDYDETPIYDESGTEIARYVGWNYSDAEHGEGKWLEILF